MARVGDSPVSAPSTPKTSQANRPVAPTTTAPETPVAKGWAPQGSGPTTVGRDGFAAGNISAVQSKAATPADGSQEVFSRYLELRGDDPRTLSGTDLSNEIGVAMHLPPNHLPQTPDDEKALENGTWNFFSGKELDAVNQVAQQVQQLGGSPAKMTALPVVFDSKQTGQISLPLFRVQGKDGKEHFVDNLGRSYKSFDDWKANNQLPPGKMTYPEGGHLSAGADGKPKVASGNTPATPDTFLKKAEGYADKAALVGGLVLGAAAVIGTGGAALAVGGAVMSGWLAFRSGKQLVDRGEHGQTLNPLKDGQARTEWLTAGSSVIGLGAMGASARVASSLATAGKASGALVNTAAALNVASEVTGTAMVADQGVGLVTHWNEMSTSDKLMSLSQMAFFGGGVYRHVQSSGSVKNLYSFDAVKEGLTHPEAKLTPQQRQALDKAVAPRGAKMKASAEPAHPAATAGAAASAKGPALRELSLGAKADPRFKLVTNDPQVTDAQAHAATKLLSDALDSDLSRDRWTNHDALKDPITVKVLTKEEYAKVGGNSAGITVDKNHFVIPSDLVKRKLSPDDIDTLAHELSHVLDMRQGNGQLHKIPAFVQEGKAYVNGAMYTREKGLVNPEAKNIHEQLGKLTAEDATEVLKQFKTGAAEMDPKAPLHKYETTGGLYLEFLRTRLNGTGKPDAMARMSAVEQKVASGKATYAQAFKEELGVEPAKANQQFVQYIKDTEGHPDQRLAGTVWQSAAEDKAHPFTKDALQQKTAPGPKKLASELYADQAPRSAVPEPQPQIKGEWKAPPKNVQLFHNGEPKAKDVQQGPLGDCYQLATRAVAAQMDPALIKSHIREVGYDPKTNSKIYGAIYYDRVDDKPPAERAKLEATRAAADVVDAMPDEHGVHRQYTPVWQLVTDKVFTDKSGSLAEAGSTVKGEGRVGWVQYSEKSVAARHGEHYRNIANGGYAAKAMEELTGRHSVHMDLHRSKDPVKDLKLADEQFQKLLEAHQQGRLTAMGSNGDAKNLKLYPQYDEHGNVAKTPYFDPEKFEYADGDGNAASTGTAQTKATDSRLGAGWVGNHEYSVLNAYVEKGVKMVELRNPWGDVRPPEFADKNKTEDGIVKIPWYLARSLFGDADIGGRATTDRGDLKDLRAPKLPKGVLPTWSPGQS